MDHITAEKFELRFREIDEARKHYATQFLMVDDVLKEHEGRLYKFWKWRENFPTQKVAFLKAVGFRDAYWTWRNVGIASAWFAGLSSYFTVISYIMWKVLK